MNRRPVKILLSVTPKDWDDDAAASKLSCTAAADCRGARCNADRWLHDGGHWRRDTARRAGATRTIGADCSAQRRTATAEGESVRISFALSARVCRRLRERSRRRAKGRRAFLVRHELSDGVDGRARAMQKVTMKLAGQPDYSTPRIR